MILILQQTILQGLLLFVKYLMSLHTAKNTELSAHIFLYKYYIARKNPAKLVEITQIVSKVKTQQAKKKLETVIYEIFTHALMCKKHFNSTK